LTRAGLQHEDIRLWRSTGRKVDAAPNQNIENNPMQSRRGALAWMLARETF
jgi:hypothetical protein